VPKASRPFEYDQTDETTIIIKVRDAQLMPVVLTALKVLQRSTRATKAVAAQAAKVRSATARTTKKTTTIKGHRRSAKTGGRKSTGIKTKSSSTDKRASPRSQNPKKKSNKTGDLGSLKGRTRDR
jgi:hypothetical protein